jgi:alpha-L-glutamate ligase-like protein
MLELHRRLRDCGVLGINRRNAEIIRRWNPRRLYPLVDDKLLTKRLALAAGMPVPELFGVIETQHDTRQLTAIVADREQFVVKPARGSGGNGVLVITGRRRDRFTKASGASLDDNELAHHISNMLSGLYSLAGQRDRVVVESYVRCDPRLAEISYQGVPDIRLIVFKGFPVMAMIRLPTHLSDGRANLHQGAVGVGIDLATGVTTRGVQEDRRIDEHPDTGQPLAGIPMPAWDRILEMAARCHEMTGLGYLGVDIVIDRDLGPLILELNARPGLAIQIANGSGLRRRLRVVEELVDGMVPVHERLDFCRREFRISPGGVDES